MIKFIDSIDGSIFDGSAEYVFWFGDKDGLSTDLIYDKQILMITDTQNVTISIPTGSFFRLVDPVKLNNATTKTQHKVFNYKYLDNITSDSITLTGKLYKSNIYIYSFNIIVCSSTPMQVRDTFTVANNTSLYNFNIGADIYDDDERLKICLQNMGVNMVDDVQRSMYSTNIYEEYSDKALLNRKWKELLNVYWDTIACKGSYNSLLRSLEWFEYGDLLSMATYWKNDKQLYEISINDLLSSTYESYLNNLAKTTYISIHGATSRVLPGVYDEEYNPVLEGVCMDWCREDMSLKMTLLGIFFSRYFAPIHVDIIQSCLENIVYTNTIKINPSGHISRYDSHYSTGVLECNVKNGDCFPIGDTSVQAARQTPYVREWQTGDTYDSVVVFGVEDSVATVKDDSDLKTFYTHNYNGPGAIVRFKCTVKTDEDAFAVREQIVLHNLSDRTSKIQTYNNIIPAIDGVIHMDFNILYKEIGSYAIGIQIDNANGEVYNDYIKFNVIDISNTKITASRIKRKYTNINFNSVPFDRLFARQPMGSGDIYKQYIPISIGSSDGPGINHRMIIKLRSGVNPTTVASLLDNSTYNGGWFTFTGKTGYIIAICKRFHVVNEDYSETKNLLTSYGTVEFEENCYFDQFHELEEIDGDTIDDYKVYRDEAVCLSVEGLQYVRDIDSPEWVLINKTTGESYELPWVHTPIAAPTDKSLPAGYYDIIFRFKTGSVQHTIIKNSMFIQMGV